MLEKGFAIYVQFPDETRAHLLHAGKVIACNEQAVSIVLEESALPIAAGQDLTVFYDMGRRFVKQAARVDALIELADDTHRVQCDSDDPRAWAIKATLTLAGQPLSAESRQCYRVSTAISDHYATLAGEKCKLMDVSATGYAVLSKSAYRVGQILPGTIEVDGRQFTGLVTVQNVRKVGRSGYRYGLDCADPKAAKGNLKDGLPQLSMAIQREQLKRRSGAA